MSLPPVGTGVCSSSRRIISRECELRHRPPRRGAPIIEDGAERVGEENNMMGAKRSFATGVGMLGALLRRM
jgi:hypothetical protein